MALHLYLLTRFSNCSKSGGIHRELYTFIYLQGSQTPLGFTLKSCRLYTFIYLQGSQTQSIIRGGDDLLYTFIYLQGSQTLEVNFAGQTGFTPLFTYKVLKPIGKEEHMMSALHLYLLTRFSNRSYFHCSASTALHLYLLTRFSNWRPFLHVFNFALHLYLLTRFSN